MGLHSAGKSITGQRSCLWAVGSQELVVQEMLHDFVSDNRFHNLAWYKGEDDWAVVNNQVSIAFLHNGYNYH